MAKTPETTQQAGALRDRRVQERLDQLRGEYRKLHEQKISTDTERKSLDEQLRTLREKAEREYGTSDVEELKALLERRRQENERMVAEYEQHIEGIKQGLESIEKGDKTPA